MGEHSMENISALSIGLAEVFKNEKVLIIASTDLSHFYQAEKALELDRIVVEHLGSFEENLLFSDLQSGKCEMCGGGPALAAMKTAKLLGADQSKVLLYRNSGDITGDKAEVVGYLSAVLYRSQSA
jgi:AmmeMemoRadiSam system protein B